MYQAYKELVYQAGFNARGMGKPDSDFLLK